MKKQWDEILELARAAAARDEQARAAAARVEQEERARMAAIRNDAPRSSNPYQNVPTERSPQHPPKGETLPLCWCRDTCKFFKVGDLLATTGVDVLHKDTRTSLLERNISDALAIRCKARRQDRLTGLQQGNGASTIVVRTVRLRGRRMVPSWRSCCPRTVMPRST